HRKVLAVSPSNGIEDAESDGESDNTVADPTGASKAIRVIAGIELVLQQLVDVGEAGLGDKVVEEGEVEITRKSKRRFGRGSRRRCWTAWKS
ncbi:hypothetical protein CRG98_049718, partial [Punica granatum]